MHLHEENFSGTRIVSIFFVDICHSTSFLKKNTIIYLVAPDFSYNSIDRQKLVLKHSVLCFLPNSKYCVLSGETERRILSCQSREIKYYSIIKSQSQTLEARTYLYIHIIFVVFTRFNTYQVVKHPS